MNQEYLIKLSMLQQEAEKISQENEAVTKQISELLELKENLLEIEKTKDKENLVSLGKGIYTKAEFKDKKLYVNIGAGVVVKKDVSSTVKLIDEQLKKLETSKANCVEAMEELNKRVKETIDEKEKLS
jgi:prefoldin alpha subunit